MCYKSELQQKNEDKLRRLLEADNICVPIKRYFYDIESKSGAVSYWYAIKDLMNWLIAEGIIRKSGLSEVTLNDFYDVDAADVNSYLHYKEDSGMSPSTLQTRKQIFSSFWEYLVDSNKCAVDHNIIRKVKYKGISPDTLVKRLPTNDQLVTMESNILKRKDDFLRIRNYAIFELLKGSGIRETELCGLDVSDLYIDGVEIPYIKVIGKGIYREIESRTVYLTNSATNALKTWLITREKVLGDCDGAVFVTKKGTRLKEKEVGNLCKLTSDGAVTPHMIRHWYATMIASKVGIALAQQQLGHKSVNTTINKYANGVYGAKSVLASI